MRKGGLPPLLNVQSQRPQRSSRPRGSFKRPSFDPSVDAYGTDFLAARAMKITSLLLLGSLFCYQAFPQSKAVVKDKGNFGLHTVNEYVGYATSDGESNVIDYTVIRPHPTKRIFLTQGDQFVKIFDSRSGELLQTVVHPLIRTDSKGKTRMTHGKTVDSVSLWKVIE